MYRATHNLFESIQSVFAFGNSKTSPQEEKKPNVLLVGYGWGGKAFSDKIDRSKYNVHVVTVNPYFLNTPKLISDVVGGNSSKISWLQVQNFRVGKCVEILPNTNTADFETFYSMTGKYSLGYDYLVLAVGSIPNTWNIPGADTCKFLKTYDDMSNLRNIINSGDPRSINIIGAGPTGVELALALATTKKPVQLIEAGGSILGGFSDVTKNAVMKELEAHSVKVELQTAISAIEEKYVIGNSQGLLASTRTFPNDLTIWTSGVKPNPLVKTLVGVGGRFTTNSNFLVNGYKNIYAIGDLVASYELGPPTAQNARAQGNYLAEYFNGGFSVETSGYKYNNVGKIIHGVDKIYIEYGMNCYTLPKSLGFIVDWFTAP